MNLVSRVLDLATRIAVELNKKADKTDLDSINSKTFMIQKTNSFMKQQTEFIKNLNNNWK
jgi:hypothetical protein